jgi:uncharacterized protein (TIGR01777 family)
MKITQAKRLKIVLPGGSGHLGGILARHFHGSGHHVTVLTRTPMAAPWRVVAWDSTTLSGWADELNGADVVVNLAGRSVDCRYSVVNRREILDSRIQPTQILGEAVGRLPNPPRLWMNASTATIYRHAMDRTMDEMNGELGGSERGVPPSWRFSIEVATHWEKTFFEATTPRTRKIALRGALVMTPERGGPFDRLLRLVRLGLGGAAGSGDQFMSWVHDADFVRALEYLMLNEYIDGVVNVASPTPLPNRDFMQVLRKAWGRKFGLTSQRWMLELGAVFLRTETELILKSRRVIPGRLLDHGFRFEFPEWGAAAGDLVQRWRSRKIPGSPARIGVSAPELRMEHE